MAVSVNRPIRVVPTTPRDFEKFIRENLDITVIAGEIAANSVETATIADSNVTLAKIANITADRFLGRVLTSGPPQELTAAQMVILLQAIEWAFAVAVQFNGTTLFAQTAQFTSAARLDGTVGFFGQTPTTQAAHIADAEVAHSLNSTFDNAEVETALDNLGGKVNSLISLLETIGIKASS